MGEINWRRNKEDVSVKRRERGEVKKKNVREENLEEKTNIQESKR